DPRKIEGEVDAGPGHEGSELIEFPQLLRPARVAMARRSDDQGFEDAAYQQALEPDAAADQNLRPDAVERRHGEERDAQDRREKDEGGQVRAHQDAGVDLQEVEPGAE